MFKALVVGVNRDLQFAGKDARDLKRAVSGAAGFVSPRDVICLQEISVRELRAALLSLCVEHPGFLLFFFSGHGTPTGIVLADGEMTFIELASWFQRIDAHAMLTILDSCHSGGFTEVGGIAAGRATVGGIDLDALEVLTNALPGNRIICSVAADRLASEGGGIANGHLTSAVLVAMGLAAGDLDGRLGALISEQRLFDVTKKIMRNRGHQTPVSRRLRGDFPVVRAQDQVVGHAAIIGAGVVDGGFQATFELVGRRGVRTTLVAQARNAAGVVLRTFRRVVMASENDDQDTFAYPVSPDDLYPDDTSAAWLGTSGGVPITWTLAVLDARRRVLARGRRTIIYADPWSPYERQRW